MEITKVSKYLQLTKNSVDMIKKIKKDIYH